MELYKFLISYYIKRAILQQPSPLFHNPLSKFNTTPQTHTPHTTYRTSQDSHPGCVSEEKSRQFSQQPDKIRRADSRRRKAYTIRQLRGELFADGLNFPVRSGDC